MKIVKEQINENLTFIRDANVITQMGVGLDWVSKKIYDELEESFFYKNIDEEIYLEIIEYLLKKGYSSEQIKKLMLSEHPKWSYVWDNLYDLARFKRYFDRNINQSKDYIIDKSEKGKPSPPDSWWKKRI